MKQSIILVLAIGVLSSVQAYDRFNHHYKPQHKVHSNVHYNKHHSSKQESIKRQMKQNQNDIVRLQNRIIQLKNQNRKYYSFLNNRPLRNNILSLNLSLK